MRRYRRGRFSGTSSSNCYPVKKLLHRLLIVISIPVQLQTASGSGTSCRVVATSHDKARITCTFLLDLNQTKRSFCVTQYEGDTKRTDVVTACSWKAAEPLCVFEEGFRFSNHVISDQFTVELPIQKAKGEFSCDTIPPDLNVELEKCTLSSTGPDDPVSTTTPQTSCNCTRPPQNDQEARTTTITLFVVSSVLIGVAVGITLLCIRNKRMARHFWKEQRKDVSVYETQQLSEPHATQQA